VQVKLVRSGGLAGLNLVATVDTADLAADQQEVVSRLLTEDLRSPGQSSGGPADSSGGPAAQSRGPGADQFSYQLEIQQGDRTVRRQWAEPEVHEALRPLLTELTRQAKPAR
jgi:hypothetical protein